VEYKGELVRWNDERGFGFIESPSSEENFFIHISTLKGMPRRPVVGDIIYFQVERGEDGKARAKSARIEGLTRTPGKTRTKKDGNGYLILFGLWVAFLVSVLVLVTFFVYYKGVEKEGFTGYSVEKEEFAGYKCEGKRYCSEMTCEEARFYVNNCPNVEIDGDGDGKPCEQQCGH
jgi:cold shock CspA family protein